MPAPTITRPATAINYGGITAVASTLPGVTAPASYNDGGMVLPNPSNSITYGCRVNLPAPVNISARKYITFQFHLSQVLRAVVLQIYFVDSAGNKVGFDLYRLGQQATRPFWNDVPPTAAGADLYFSQNVVVDGPYSNTFCIALDATPDTTYGSAIDWTQLAAYEILCVRNASSSTSMTMYALRFAAIDSPSMVGGDTVTPATLSAGYDLFFTDWVATTSPYKHNAMLKPAAPFQNNATEGALLTLTYDLLIGDGSTATRLEASGPTIIFRPSYDRTFLDQYPAVQLSTSTKRLFGWNASASDYTRLNGFLVTACYVADGGEYDFLLQGSAAADIQLSNGTIFNAGQCVIEIGTLDTVVFKKCNSVVYDSTATLTNCSIINNEFTGSTGLTIDGAPGDYSGAGIRFADNTGGHDVTITPTATGTYDLSGLSVKTGQSLKIHNATATAITVKLATGVTATTSGTGAITIEYPVTLANASITNLVAGSRVRIYNKTTDTELFNNIIAGTSYSADYTDGTDYSAGDIISVRVAWMSGTSAKLPVEYLTVATVNGWSVLANQQDDTVYNTNAIDGSTITEFIADYPNVQIDVDDPDGTTTPQRCYAWYIAGQMTADGITNYHGAITAEDEFNYRVNVDVVSLHGQNISTNPLLVVGARIYRSDGAALFVPGSGPVQMEYGRVYALETGVSGLTPTESAALLAIPTNPLLTNDTRLDNLDAAISTRLPTSSYIAAPTTTQIRTELATELSRIDTTISSRLSSVNYVEPDNVPVLTAISNLNDISEAQVQTLLDSIPTEVLSAANTNPISANIKRINNASVIGTGAQDDQWRGESV